MADFCFEATVELFGDGAKNDFAGICASDELVSVLCEGTNDTCGGGVHFVDHEGHWLNDDGTRARP